MYKNKLNEKQQHQWQHPDTNIRRKTTKITDWREPKKKIEVYEGERKKTRDKFYLMPMQCMEQIYGKYKFNVKVVVNDNGFLFCRC